MSIDTSAEAPKTYHVACVASVPVRAERERAFSHSGRRKIGRKQKCRRSGVLPHFCSRLTSRAAESPSPHFSRGPNAKKLFRLVRYHSGTLATQATYHANINRCIDRHIGGLSTASRPILGQHVGRYADRYSTDSFGRSIGRRMPF